MSQSERWSRPAWVGIVLVAGMFWGLAGCDSTKQPSEDTGVEAPQTRSYASESAPYALEYTSRWERLEPASLNSHADFAATLGETLYVMVIPQKLPKVGTMKPPSANALKAASVSRMSENIKEFRTEREGPVELGPTSGISVFAEGVSEGTHVQYIATYFTHKGWGYQVIAWGPAYTEKKLVDAVDGFFEGWQFTADSLRSASPDADARDPDAGGPGTAQSDSDTAGDDETSAPADDSDTNN